MCLFSQGEDSTYAIICQISCTAYKTIIEKGKQAPYLKRLERIAECLGIESYELLMFEEGDKRSARKAAIQELVMLLQNKSPDDIRFTASILRQVMERGK